LSTKIKSRLLGDVKFRTRFLILLVPLVLASIIPLDIPSPYVYFLDMDSTGRSDLNNSYSVHLSDIAIKLNKDVLWFDGQPVPESVRGAVYNAWPHTSRMRAIRVNNTSGLDHLPSGLLLVLRFYTAKQARNFCLQYPDAAFRPTLRKGNIVFLAENQTSDQIRSLMEPVRNIMNTYALKGLAVLGIMAVMALTVTSPSCKITGRSRFRPKRKVYVSARERTLLKKATSDRLTLVRIGLLILLTGLLLDFAYQCGSLYQPHKRLKSRLDPHIPLFAEIVLDQIPIILVGIGILGVAHRIPTRVSSIFLALYSFYILVVSVIRIYESGDPYVWDILFFYDDAPVSLITSGLGLGFAVLSQTPQAHVTRGNDVAPSICLALLLFYPIAIWVGYSEYFLMALAVLASIAATIGIGICIHGELQDNN